MGTLKKKRTRLKPKFKAIVTKYEPLVKSMASRYRTLSYDDCYQEGMLGLIIAALTFDKSKGRFGPYAKLIIRHRLNALYNYEKKHHKSRSYSEDYKATYTERKYNDILTTESFKKIIGELNEADRHLVIMRLMNKTQKEVAASLGVSQPKVSRMLVKIRKELLGSEQ